MQLICLMFVQLPQGEIRAVASQPCVSSVRGKKLCDAIFFFSMLTIGLQKESSPSLLCILEVTVM